MKAFLFGSLCALGFIGCASVDKHQTSCDPREAARDFYEVVQVEKIDGLPEGKAWKKLEPLVTPELAKSVRVAQKYQKDFMKENPGEKPPWVEGDLFGSLFEGAQKREPGVPKVNGNVAEVPVKMAYSDRGQTVKWTDILILKRVSRGWLVDNLRYGGKWPFAPKGNLITVLTPETCAE